MEPGVYEKKPGIPEEAYAHHHQHDDERYLYLKVAVAALAVSIVAALIIYFCKPNAFLKVKNDKKSGLDFGLVALTCIGVFIITFGIVFLLFRSLWNHSPGMYVQASHID